jgi:hypothetical protein
VFCLFTNTLTKLAATHHTNKTAYVHSVDWERISHGKDELSSGRAIIATNIYDLLLKMPDKVDEYLDILVANDPNSYRICISGDSSVIGKELEKMCRYMSESILSDDYGVRAFPCDT